jgi:hypothetical protein
MVSVRGMPAAAGTAGMAADADQVPASATATWSGWPARAMLPRSGLPGRAVPAMARSGPGAGQQTSRSLAGQGRGDHRAGAE